MYYIVCRKGSCWVPTVDSQGAGVGIIKTI